MKNQLHYLFETVTHCEMCNDVTSTHKVLGQRLNTSQGLSPKKQTGISVSVMQCTNCNLIYASPQPIPYDIQQHYGMPPEEYWRSVYFNEEHNVFKKEIDIVKNKLPFANGMKALDIGAGLGKVMNALTQHGFDVYGLEPSVPFYERAISLSKIATDKLKLGMVENVTYPKNTFDFITYGAVFEHLYHPAHSLEKSLEWLKPNGIVHIEVPSSNHFIAKLVNFYYKLRGTNYVTHLSPMHAPFHLYEFSHKSFEALATKLNCTIEHLQYDVCEIYFAPKITHAVLRKYMQWTNTGMQLTVYLRKK